MELDLRVVEMLASKLCHDLISPVGAINNGVELVEEIGGDVVDDAMKLIGDSSACAARLLKIYRIAYGRAGAEAGVSLRDVRALAGQYFESGKVKLVWADDVPLADFAERVGAMKILLNTIMMADEVLAYGGSITVMMVGDACGVEVSGRNAVLNDGNKLALSGDVTPEDLTTRNLQFYITGKFATHFGFKITHEQMGEERLRVMVG